MSDTPTHITHNLSVQPRDEEMMLLLDGHIGVQITETLTPQQALSLLMTWLDECNDVTRIRVFLALKERYPNYFD